MPRLANSLGLVLIPMALVASGCSDDCKSPFDCKSSEVCYDGTCVDGLSKNLLCQVDDDCGIDPGAGAVRPYICVAGRCAANPSRFPAAPVLDTGVVVMDAGMDATVTDLGVDTGVVTPADTGMMGAPDTGITPSMCSFPRQTAMAKDSNAPVMFTPRVAGVDVTAGMSVNVMAPGPADITFSVAEAGCGIESVKLTIVGDAQGNQPPDIMAIDGVVEGNNPFTVRARVPINDCLTPNRHRVISIAIRDVAGNTVVYTAAAGNTYQQATHESTMSSDSGIPIIAFTPQTSGGAPPALTGLTATGDANGISVNITKTDAMGCMRTNTTLTVTSTRGHRITASGTTDTIAVPIPACARSGAWTVESVAFTDAASRSATFVLAGTYRNGALDSLVNAATARPVGAGADRDSPVVLAAAAIGSTDPMGTAAMTELTATDGCGLGTGVASYRLETGGRAWSFTGSLSGGPASAFGCVAIPACAPAGNYQLSFAQVADQAGSTTSLRAVTGTYTVVESDGTRTSTGGAVRSVMHP